MSIALTTNKVAAAAVGVAMVFSFAFVTPASAQTVEELTAQINSLLSTITSLQAQLAGISGGTTTTGSYNFTLNHSQGDEGGEVMDIQKFLNAKGFTVSTSGAGSPGNESSYFGAKTKAAVVAFQNANAATVLAPVGLSAGTGYWGPSSRAAANAMSAGTGTGTGTGTTPTGTGLTVSAAAQPGNSLAPYNAARVPFTKFTLTNNSGSAQTVSGVTVQLTGLASNVNFTGVVLLDQNGNQLGIDRILNSNKQATIGENVTLQAGESRTFTVAANMAAQGTVRPGEVASFSVVAINTSATVAGSLPITGAAHTINATLALSSATVDRGVNYPATDGLEKNVGETGVDFTSVRITAGSQEDIRVHSLRFNQSGSASTGDLSNVHVVSDGVTYQTTVSNDGKYYVVNLGSGIVINKGLVKEFTVRGDIVSGAGRTVSMDVFKLTDIQVTGETYGYGITPTATGQFSASATPAHNENNINITAGTFESISRSNVVPTGNIAKQVPNTNLGAFQLAIAGEAVQVSTVAFGLEISGGQDGSAITNITLVDQNGAVLAGPVDGSDTAVNGATGGVTFSGVEFPAGTTVVTLKGQLGSGFANNNTVQVTVNIGTGWSGATGLSTGNSITLTGSASGNTRTVKAAALTASTLATPVARTIVAGTSDFVWATASLNAADSGEDIRVTSVKVTVTPTTGAAAPNKLQNVAIWANLSGGNTNDSVRGDKYETKISNTEQFTTTTTAAQTVTFTIPSSLLVDANTTKEIAVVGNLSSNAAANETYTVRLAATAGVVGVASNTGTAVSVDTTQTGQTMTVAAAGALTVTVDASSPSASILLDNTSSEQTVGVFRFAASNVEAINVDSIVLDQNGTNSNRAVASYRLYKGGATTPFATVTNTGAAEITHNLADGALVIPANSNVQVVAKAVLNDIDGTSIANGHTVVLELATTTAKGADSSQTVTDAAAAGTATHTVYEAYPVIAFDNTTVSGGNVLVPSTSYRVARLIVTNPGDKDVTFSTGASSQLVINYAITGTLSATTSATTLRDVSTGNTLSTGNIAAATGATTATFSTWSNQLTVPANGSKTVDVYVNTTGLGGTNTSIQASFAATAANLTFGIEGSGAFQEGDVIFRDVPTGAAHYRN